MLFRIVRHFGSTSVVSMCFLKTFTWLDLVKCSSLQIGLETIWTSWNSLCSIENFSVYTKARPRSHGSLNACNYLLSAAKQCSPVGIMNVFHVPNLNAVCCCKWLKNKTRQRSLWLVFSDRIQSRLLHSGMYILTPVIPCCSCCLPSTATVGNVFQMEWWTEGISAQWWANMVLGLREFVWVSEMNHSTDLETRHQLLPNDHNDDVVLVFIWYKARQYSVAQDKKTSSLPQK